jgi:hypothetical protein
MCALFTHVSPALHFPSQRTALPSAIRVAVETTPPSPRNSGEIEPRDDVGPSSDPRKWELATGKGVVNSQPVSFSGPCSTRKNPALGITNQLPCIWRIKWAVIWTVFHRASSGHYSEFMRLSDFPQCSVAPPRIPPIHRIDERNRGYAAKILSRTTMTSRVVLAQL